MPQIEDGLSARRETGGSFVSMGCPIVNTLFAHNSAATSSPSLRQQSWNSAPPDGVRRPGTTPVSRALPRALAWSTILCRSPHTGLPSLDSRAGWHLGHGETRGRATYDMSQFRQFHRRPRRTLLRRPAGLLVTVDDPLRRSHHPRARRLLRVNSAAELQLTAPCSSLSLIRLSFQPRVRRTVHRRTNFVVGFPPCGRPRARHSGDRRFESVVASDSGSISFVSYPPLQVRHNSYLVAIKAYAPFRWFI